jgi:hypothetical protein
MYYYFYSRIEIIFKNSISLKIIKIMNKLNKKKGYFIIILCPDNYVRHQRVLFCSFLEVGISIKGVRPCPPAPPPPVTKGN